MMILKYLSKVTSSDTVSMALVTMVEVALMVDLRVLGIGRVELRRSVIIHYFFCVDSVGSTDDSTVDKLQIVIN